MFIRDLSRFIWLPDDDNFNLRGYNKVRADHPSNTKISGVCIYFKNSLLLKILDIQLLQECINFEIKIAGKACNFISLYGSSSQSKDEFESFADNLELNLDSNAFRNPYLIVVLGDFLAQTKGWCPYVKQLMKALKLMVLRLNADWNNWFMNQPILLDRGLPV